MGFKIKTVICVLVIGDLISVLKYTWHWKWIITETLRWQHLSDLQTFMFMVKVPLITAVSLSTFFSVSN